MGVDETVKHVVLECERFVGDRREMLHAVFSEMGYDICLVTEDWKKVNCAAAGI